MKTNTHYCDSTHRLGSVYCVSFDGISILKQKNMSIYYTTEQIGLISEHNISDHEI